MSSEYIQESWDIPIGTFWQRIRHKAKMIWLVIKSNHVVTVAIVDAEDGADVDIRYCGDPLCICEILLIAEDDLRMGLEDESVNDILRAVREKQ